MPETLKRRLIYDDDLVEDSEPEREEKRQKLREQKRKKKYLRLDPSRADQLDQDVNELTITELNPPGPSAAVGGQSQINKPVGASSPLTELDFYRQLETTDHVAIDSLRPLLAPGIAPDRCKHRANAPDTANGPHNAQKMSGMNRTSTYPTPPPIATLEVPLSSDSESESHLKLSRFAFRAPSSKPKITDLGGLSRSGSVVATEQIPGSTSAAKARLKRPNVQRFSNDFSDKQLASLTNCVSCNLKWTSTKTASQKVIHIQNCAKKKFISDETVRTLIRKEIQSSSDQNASGHQKTTEGGQKPATFLETVVNEVSRTKKGRRPVVLGTVKSLPETRGSILGRARAVLDTSLQHGDSVVGAQVSGWAQGSRSDVPCTQAFGTSMLARRADSYPRAQSGPPQTQAFGESALGCLQSNLGVIARHAQTSGL
ncbi:hypothetical protein DEU56DRAFT_224120 [Suillus clintonianus]|uniref:uncharacterized protein n=1 Tax=Suillus clintonianus TaxID=1904413 RepID=UPI001B87B9E3|nr:uncharacterized protein DEU56DRAFT_224120 [Suillus clintonianus]KAG2156194.1 hypothetical protein DEU56DRAFT_224120 [Suillus clintonianus]